MAITHLKGNPLNTVGALPLKGTQAVDFCLTANDLSDKSLSDFAGKKLILNIFPSIDTAVCAMSVRRFNQEAASLPETVVLCISMDLPFAQARFCGAEGIQGVVTLSEMRDDSFGNQYGVRLADGPLKGLLARAIVVLDTNHKVVYTELVDDIVHEPDYAKAIEAVKAV